jgi:ketopantoate hydroxymethyltransferase
MSTAVQSRDSSLQQERVAAFREFAADVEGGAYPGREHAVRSRMRSSQLSWSSCPTDAEPT